MTRLPAIAGSIASLLLLATATPPEANAADRPASRPLVNERCPVTTEEFATPSHETQFQGASVRFCCEKCERRFLADPASYVSNLPQFTPEMVERTIAESGAAAWTPMPEPWLVRWLRPILLAIAGVIGLWLVIRIARRYAGSMPPPGGS
jgi:hypothetical protein